MRSKLLVGAVGGLVVAALLVAGRAILWQRSEPQVQARLPVPADAATGFARTDGPRPFDFPADHGPHPDYQTEWWYYTGNLETADGRHFGYQLTLFRRGLVPPAQRRERASTWAADQVYMAHFALTDVGGGQHRAFERFSRGAAGLAGAEALPYGVWLEDWSIKEVESGVVRLWASEGGVAVDLLLADLKGPVLQGEGGYSRKGPEPGNASYYFSQTRLESSGTVQVGDAVYPVDGISWMDHEFSTSALGPDQIGWDWFALQLDDASPASGEAEGELMVFQIRRADGSVDPFSSGTFVAHDGSACHLSGDDFEIRVDGTWLSPHSGATYPARWRIEVPAAEMILEVVPYLADQELNVSYTYWEGAVRVRGEWGGSAVSGLGYVEMTGYAHPMQELF